VPVCATVPTSLSCSCHAPSCHARNCRELSSAPWLESDMQHVLCPTRSSCSCPQRAAPERQAGVPPLAPAHHARRRWRPAPRAACTSWTSTRTPSSGRAGWLQWRPACPASTAPGWAALRVACIRQYFCSSYAKIDQASRAAAVLRSPAVINSSRQHCTSLCPGLPHARQRLPRQLQLLGPSCSDKSASYNGLSFVSQL
jgi:hypothetical protein